jgi:predicted alpha-1,2-mannosidase
MGRGWAAEPTPLESVRPMVGTGEHGHTYPGATVPFGMVQLSPDTRLDTWDGCSGYHDSDKAILGFSHTHLSGTGCADLGDIRFIPLSGATIGGDGVKSIRPLKFSHADETAKPGYYSVLAGEPKVKVELTAAAHSGFHRYTFPADQAAQVIIDLERGIVENTIEVKPPEGNLVVAKDNKSVSGCHRSHGWAAEKTYYFAAEFSRPFETAGVTSDGGAFKTVKEANIAGKKVYGMFTFKASSEPLLVKVGISACSVEAARKNLAAEIPAWDFDGTVAAAEKSWSDVLDRIEIKTADPVVREIFYTSIYHAAVAPTLFNDVDGSYRGLDHKVHAAAKFQNYCTFSFWDTHRAEHPLLTIIQPQRIDDFINTILADYREFNQHNLPVWPLAGNETWCMVANHSIPVITDAYLKGFRGFDAEAAYNAMRDTAMQDRRCLDEYRKYGYVLTGKDKQSVSRTLEYAYDDWCIAQMAKALGKTDDTKLFAERAKNYQKVFDPATQFMRGKTVDGRWRESLDPCEPDFIDYTEGTAWNYTWFVPHDPPGLIALFGGDEPFVKKLDALFVQDTTLVSRHPDLTGLIGQYIHGNEPCHHILYLYAYAGEPWKTQPRVRQVMKSFYGNKRDGVCGNDDCGQMSAWYILSALGIYPVNPSSSVYVIGSPLVDRATIHLDPKYQKGKTFTVIAENNSPKNIYVQSATLNGKPLKRSWISHTEIVDGGELTLKMGPAPNVDWAKSPENRPPLAAFAP